MRKNLFGLSPATRDLVRELWQKRTLRDRLTGDHRTLRIIEEIRIAREPAAIGDLMPLGLADKHPEAQPTLRHQLMVLRHAHCNGLLVSFHYSKAAGKAQLVIVRFQISPDK